MAIMLAIMLKRFAALFSLLLITPLPLVAQDTPTEQEAARDVLKKMAALEQSLDVPGWVAQAHRRRESGARPRRRPRQGADGQGAPRDGRRHRDASRKSGSRRRGRSEAHRLSEAARLRRGDRRRRAETAFVAKYKKNNGAPTLGVILEYDALRGTKGAFHGDQHSAQGPVGIAAAVAMAEYLTSAAAPGSVVVYGTPGEEMMPPNAKTVMHEAHVFDGADVIVRSHSVRARRRGRRRASAPAA